MPNLKVKKGNDTLTFGLTDNLRDAGEKRLPIVISGKTYYARLGADKNALVVQHKSDGSKSYIQTSPILFNTWQWQKYTENIRGTEKMFVYLPKGRYRATVYGERIEKNEFAIATSTDIEVNVIPSNKETEFGLIIIVNGFKNIVSYVVYMLKIKIERIGE